MFAIYSVLLLAVSTQFDATRIAHRTKDGCDLDRTSVRHWIEYSEDRCTSWIVSRFLGHGENTSRVIATTSRPAHQAGWVSPTDHRIKALRDDGVLDVYSCGGAFLGQSNILETENTTAAAGEFDRNSDLFRLWIGEEGRIRCLEVPDSEVAPATSLEARLLWEVAFDGVTVPFDHGDVRAIDLVDGVLEVQTDVKRSPMDWCPWYWNPVVYRFDPETGTLLDPWLGDVEAGPSPNSITALNLDGSPAWTHTFEDSELVAFLKPKRERGRWIAYAVVRQGADHGALVSLDVNGTLTHRRGLDRIVGTHVFEEPVTVFGTEFPVVGELLVFTTNGTSGSVGLYGFQHQNGTGAGMTGDYRSLFVDETDRDDIRVYAGGVWNSDGAVVFYVPLQHVRSADRYLLTGLGIWNPFESSVTDFVREGDYVFAIAESGRWYAFDRIWLEDDHLGDVVVNDQTVTLYDRFGDTIDAVEFEYPVVDATRLGVYLIVLVDTPWGMKLDALATGPKLLPRHSSSLVVDSRDHVQVNKIEQYSPRTALLSGEDYVFVLFGSDGEVSSYNHRGPLTGRSGTIQLHGQTPEGAADLVRVAIADPRPGLGTLEAELHFVWDGSDPALPWESQIHRVAFSHPDRFPFVEMTNGHIYRFSADWEVLSPHLPLHGPSELLPGSEAPFALEFQEVEDLAALHVSITTDPSQVTISPPVLGSGGAALGLALQSQRLEDGWSIQLTGEELGPRTISAEDIVRFTLAVTSTSAGSRGKINVSGVGKRADGAEVWVRPAGRELSMPAAVPRPEPISDLVLEQNSPNPFNPTTRIGFSTRQPAELSLSIYDASGRRVTTLLNEWRSAGEHEVIWHGTDEWGTPVASGIYFYILDAVDQRITRRLTLVR